jgi:hypothetical protein
MEILKTRAIAAAARQFDVLAYGGKLSAFGGKVEKLLPLHCNNGV